MTDVTTVVSANRVFAPATYRIVRHFFRSHRTQVILTGLLEHQAQEHCKDKDTSSVTCYSPQAVRRTQRCGAWFDGYEREV